MVTDRADYHWVGYRANALGKRDAPVSPRPLYLALGGDDDTRRRAHPDLFRSTLDEKPLSDLQTALNQTPPIGNDPPWWWVAEVRIAPVDGDGQAQRRIGFYNGAVAVVVFINAVGSGRRYAR